MACNELPNATLVSTKKMNARTSRLYSCTLGRVRKRLILIMYPGGIIGEVPLTFPALGISGVRSQTKYQAIQVPNSDLKKERRP